MPIYGAAKQRNMMRSILPATRRESHRRDARAVKQVNRRRTRQTLHDWKRHIDPYDFEGFVYDYTDAGSPYTDCWQYGGGIGGVVAHRRDHDKVHPLMRWATAITKHIDDPFERYAYMERLLPNTLIGRHALTHIDGLPGFEKLDEFSFHGRYANLARFLAND